MLSTLRYHLRLVRAEQLALPAGLWALCALMVVLFREDGGRQTNVAVAYLGMVVPLTAGILASGAILEDPALELQLAAPRPAWRLLVERVAVVLAIAGVAAAAFQVLAVAAGVPTASLGGLARRQLAWLVPSAALCGLSTAASLALGHAMAGALLVGLGWMVQVFMREGMSATPWGRYIYLFMGARQPRHPELLANQACLLTLAAALVATGAVLLRRQERYL
jgi:hypothetical protein